MLQVLRYVDLGCWALRVVFLQPDVFLAATLIFVEVSLSQPLAIMSSNFSHKVDVA